MTSEWAQRLVEQRKEKQEQRRLADQKTLSDREMVRTNAVPRWQNICNLLTKFIGELNEASGENLLQVGVGNDVTIVTTKDNPNSIGTIHFDSRNRALKVPFYGAEIALAVNSRNELVWKSTADSKVWSDEQVARKTAEYIWEMLSRE